MQDVIDIAGAGPLTAAGASLLIIALAEIGDKSQFVCMTLAARHPRLPVFVGASLAFALLNLVAVGSGPASKAGCRAPGSPWA